MYTVCGKNFRALDSRARKGFKAASLGRHPREGRETGGRRASMGATRIWQRLLVGSMADTRELARSNSFGVTTVITLCREKLQNFAAGINYVYFPLRSSGRVPRERFDEIMDALWEN